MLTTSDLTVNLDAELMALLADYDALLDTEDQEVLGGFEDPSTAEGEELPPDEEIDEPLPGDDEDDTTLVIEPPADEETGDQGGVDTSGSDPDPEPEPEPASDYEYDFGGEDWAFDLQSALFVGRRLADFSDLP